MAVEKLTKWYWHRVPGLGLELLLYIYVLCVFVCVCLFRSTVCIYLQLEMLIPSFFHLCHQFALPSYMVRSSLSFYIILVHIISCWRKMNLFSYLSRARWMVYYYVVFSKLFPSIFINAKYEPFVTERKKNKLPKRNVYHPKIAFHQSSLRALNPIRQSIDTKRFVRSDFSFRLSSLLSEKRVCFSSYKRTGNKVERPRGQIMGMKTVWNKIGQPVNPFSVQLLFL